MFSQSSIDSMSIDELVNLVRSIAYEVSDRINDPQDALDYCHALGNLTQNLQERIEDVIED
jgi:hypothetical protein